MKKTVKTLPSTPGIYEVVNIVNGMRYVGSTGNLRKRRGEHRAYLKMGKHRNRLLQEDWNQYGLNNFRFNILLFCSSLDLLFYEQRALSQVNQHKNGYNQRIVVDSNLGLKHTKATKKKQAESKIGALNPNYGKKLSKEHRGRISEANKGKIVSKETRKKMSEWQRGEKSSMYGKHLSAATREKIAKSLKGHRHTKSTKQKISESKIGSKNPHSRAVIQYSKSFNIINYFGWMNAATNTTGIDDASISRVCRGRQKTAGGYAWRYAEQILLTP